MQAALLENWQARVTESNNARTRSAQWFIDKLCLVNRGNDIAYLRLPIIALDHESREKLLSLSKRQGLGLSAMYPMPINEIKELRERFEGSSFPVAKEVSQKILTIPTHQLLTQSDREKIAALKLSTSRLSITDKSHSPQLTS